MKSLAVVLEQPERLSLTTLPVDSPAAGDVVVETLWTGVSAGTERLLYTGQMPHFPGMGYPLVPGYETVGRVVDAGPDSRIPVGARVFVPGARCFGPVRGLHGGAASRLVTRGDRVVPVSESLGEKAVLLALAATALHALSGSTLEAGALIVGHGVLGRLMARLATLRGGEPPVVWETNANRRDGGTGYAVTTPEDDSRKSYPVVIDVSGDASALDLLVQRLAPGGEIVLAGFYDRVSFAFPPAFMREARFRVTAQWREGDLAEAARLVESGLLSLDGLITHRAPASSAPEAYPVAFGDPACLKMVLDWRTLA
ncbi:chlorophyll synthesis pathway protein BchC [Roseiarcus fermentans]|uniref:chlorophyll synthesis pathway protein BchC n=1 Tax=Roseiarcus fermentans TaxID=1473586 RepID=UPI000DE930E6|nr:chlorophyll synthesis pathway protein BchC [Roseiarcus fermentans]